MTHRLRRFTRSRPLATIAVAVALGAGSAVVQAADPRLDEADQALQKASALVDASQTGGVSPKVQKQFDHHTDRAIELIDRARTHIQAAKEAVDGELGSSAPAPPDDAADSG